MVVLACAVLLPGRVTAEAKAPGRGDLVFGMVGRALHAAPGGAPVRTLQGSPALVLDVASAPDGSAWYRVLGADLHHGWLRLGEDARWAPAELRVEPEELYECPPEQEDGCGAPEDFHEQMAQWDSRLPVSVLGASQRGRCLGPPRPLVCEVPWLKVSDGVRTGWADPERLRMSWAPVTPGRGGACVPQAAFGLEGLVRGLFLHRPEWKELEALVYRAPRKAGPGCAAGVLTAAVLSGDSVTLLSNDCQRVPLPPVEEEPFTDLVGFEFLEGKGCRDALLLDASHSSGHGDGTTLFIIPGEGLRRSRVKSHPVSASRAEGESSFTSDGAWWTEPSGKGHTLWLAHATKEQVENGAARPPKATAERVSLNAQGRPVASAARRGFPAVLLAEHEAGEDSAAHAVAERELAARVAPVEACLKRPVPRFQVLREGTWRLVAGRLFEDSRRADAWKKELGRCGVKAPVVLTLPAGGG